MINKLWIREHKIKLASLLVISLVLGGVIYLSNEKDTFCISVDLKQNIVDNEFIQLTVKIVPLEHIKGRFEIEIKPENYQCITILEEDVQYNAEKQSLIIDLGRLDLKVGMNWPFIYYFSEDKNQIVKKQKIDVIVRYIPENLESGNEEHHEEVYL